MLNFKPGEYSGNFKNDENYHWEVDIAPYDSPLNDEEKSIQLQKILLKVFWEDQGQTRNVELATLHLTGQTYPVANTRLEKLFSGGSSPASSNEGDEEGEEGEEGEGEGEEGSEDSESTEGDSE